MADFLTRLAERTLGAAPVVQPLIAPGFAPEPNANPPDPGWNAEAPLSGDLRDAAPPAGGSPGRPGNMVVERPGDRGNVAPNDPDPREDGAEVASPPGARASSPPKPHSAEDVPDRASSRPAETEGGAAPPIKSHASAYEPAAPVKPVGEARPDRDAPDELRSTEASAPGARSDVRQPIRSIVGASPGKQEAPEPGAWAARVEPAAEMPATRDNAEGRSEEAAKTLPGRRDEPSPTTPNRAARAAEVSTVIPAKPASPSLPPASSDLPDLPSHASGLTAEQERRTGPLSRAAPDRREGEPEASQPTSAAPDSTLASPMMGPSDAYLEGSQRWQSPPEPSEPIIRVNIGRVEVRAVTPPPPRQQAAKPARLSLDDYLRSRAGGRR